MKPAVRHLLALLLTLLCVAGLAIALHAAARTRHETLCRAVEVTVCDSLSRRFVTAKDVLGYLDEYGCYIGQRIDSVDLPRIERLLEGRSAIRGSEAFITGDGVLHVRVTQREPVLRIHTESNGCYCDAEGFLFPLQHADAARVPVIDGAVPLSIPRGFKGRPESDAEKQWLSEVLGLLSYLESSRTWNGFFGQISVQPGGDLLLIPRTGRERFNIGPARGLEAKFGRIRTYYEAVVPAGDPGRYGSVDVRYDKQIICK